MSGLSGRNYEPKHNLARLVRDFPLAARPAWLDANPALVYLKPKSWTSSFVVLNQRLESKLNFEIQRHPKKHIVWQTVLIELYTVLRVQPSLLKTIINIHQCQIQVMENQCRSIH